MIDYIDIQGYKSIKSAKVDLAFINTMMSRTISCLGFFLLIPVVLKM
jgi:hypothetical protein